MKLKKILIDYLLGNKTLFKMIYICVVMLSAVPYIHDKIGSYVKYILVWGLFLVLIDMIKSKGRMLLDKYVVLLMLFCVAYGVTILLNRGAFFSESIKSLIYMAMSFLVVFYIEPSKEREEVKKEAELISREIIILTFILSVVCFITFLFQINIKYKIDGQAFYIGMRQNRLWGLYNPNIGATLALVSCLLSSFSISVIRKKYWTIFAGCNIVVQFLMIVLTLSRTVTYGAYIGLFFLLILLMPFFVPKISGKTVKNILSRILISVLIIGLLFGVIKVGEKTLYKVPELISVDAKAAQADTDLAVESDNQREDVGADTKGGVLNGRQYLWKAGFQVFKTAPVFGVAKENIYEKGKELVEIKSFRKAFKRSGLHNIYITVLAASGIVGFLILMIFILFGLKDVYKGCRHIKTIRGNEWFIVMTFIVFLYFIMEMFEARILYEVNINFLMFWTFLGYAISLSRGFRHKA